MVTAEGLQPSLAKKDEDTQKKETDVLNEMEPFLAECARVAILNFHNQVIITDIDKNYDFQELAAFILPLGEANSSENCATIIFNAFVKYSSQLNGYDDFLFSLINELPPEKKNSMFLSNDVFLQQFFKIRYNYLGHNFYFDHLHRHVIEIILTIQQNINFSIADYTLPQSVVNVFDNILNNFFKQFISDKLFPKFIEQEIKSIMRCNIDISEKFLLTYIFKFIHKSIWDNYDGLFQDHTPRMGFDRKVIFLTANPIYKQAIQEVLITPVTILTNKLNNRYSQKPLSSNPWSAWQVKVEQICENFQKEARNLIALFKDIKSEQKIESTSHLSSVKTVAPAQEEQHLEIKKKILEKRTSGFFGKSSSESRLSNLIDKTDKAEKKAKRKSLFPQFSTLRSSMGKRFSSADALSNLYSSSQSERSPVTTISEMPPLLQSNTVGTPVVMEESYNTRPSNKTLAERSIDLIKGFNPVIQQENAEKFLLQMIRANGDLEETAIIKVFPYIRALYLKVNNIENVEKMIVHKCIEYLNDHAKKPRRSNLYVVAFLKPDMLLEELQKKFDEYPESNNTAFIDDYATPIREIFATIMSLDVEEMVEIKCNVEKMVVTKCKECLEAHEKKPNKSNLYIVAFLKPDLLLEAVQKKFNEYNEKHNITEVINYTTSIKEIFTKMSPKDCEKYTEQLNQIRCAEEPPAYNSHIEDSPSNFQP